MSNTAIRVDFLSKRYRIGLAEEQPDTLVGAALSWFSNYRRLRRLSTFDDNEAGDDVIWALRDVSFEVKQGEVVGIIGANGAGKSTLLKLLARITEPTSGRAVINGRVVSLLEVGTGFHPELTGRENIYLNGTVLGMSKREVDQKFDEIVGFSGVGKFIDTPIKRYSSGMQVRLAFAVAAHLEPEILLIDEVLAVGDAAFQQKCLGKMKDIVYEGRTVLFVSHQMSAISNLTERCLLIRGGRLVEDGPTDDVIQHYLSEIEERLPEGAYVDLSTAARSPIANRDRAEFQWIRLRDQAGQEKGIFLEGEPILFEVGLTLKQPVALLQMSLGIGLIHEKSELFTVPAKVDDAPLEPGSYVARLMIDPCFLRGGHYRVVLKLLTDGMRQDTLTSAMMLNIVSYVPAGEDSAYFERWVPGPLRFNYTWESLQPYDAPEAVSSKQKRATWSL